MIENQLFKHFRHIFYGLFLGLIFFAPQIRAAVTIDNTSRGGASDTISGITTLSWSHTVNSCTNCVLYVGVSTFTQTNFPSARVLDVTYGTQTLTAIGTQVSPFPQLPATGNTSVELFRLIAPTAGTATVTVNFLVPVNYAVGGANSLNGVSGTIPNSAFVSASGDSATPAVTTSGAFVGDLVLDILGTTPNGVFTAPDASQISRYNGRSFFFNAFDVGAGSTESPVASNTPMTWTISNSAVWALGAIVVRQSLTTASTASISGRIKTENGNAINDATVILQNLTTGEEFRAATDKRGFYRFDDLELTRLYRVRVVNKNYRFPISERILSLFDSVEDCDFVGIIR